MASKQARALTQVKKQLPFASLPPPPTPPQLTETQQGKLSDLQQAKSDRRTLRRTARRDKQAATGAARMLRSGLAQAESELRAQGLTGTELTNAIKEFTSRQVDAIAGAQLQKQVIRTKFRSDQTQANQDISGLRAEKQGIFADLRTQATQDQAAYQQKSGEAALRSQEAGLTAAVAAQGKRAARAKAQKKAAGGALTPTQQRAIATAQQNALLGVTAALRAASPDDINKIRQNPQAFVTSAASHIEGAGPTDIRWALQQLVGRIRAARQGDGNALRDIRGRGIGGKRAAALVPGG